ncbi:outer membrane protein assembly factor BamE [Rhodanobacter sp. L36]|uniref:outer membrane protein assembly factor BamE domain-containing protein n=1 Tax=Rhodanobacter sp. L36 TaxID=1747221 RepID=UPI00131AA4FA|nr:outer membrane protein assembly factor BamE [Rhodanobacter sp. L36]
MQISLTKSMGMAAVLLFAGALCACGNISHKVAADGSTAEQLIWPSPQSAISIHRDGTFPNVSDLRLIQSGMNKQQILQLIGAPHFSEGVWGVREWNYLFNFRKPGSDEVTQCQYKVLFDEQKLARSFYWKPESCGALLKEEKAGAPQVVKEQTFTLQSDALFAFDRSGLKDIKPGGTEQLVQLAKKVEAIQGEVRHIHVVGYTDRLGDDTYNQTLSEKRADTVMQVLQENGVPADRMNSEGRGESDPVTMCDIKDHVALIACLAPNRRVEVRVDGAQ